jgi:hypothetical protein
MTKTIPLTGRSGFLGLHVCEPMQDRGRLLRTNGSGCTLAARIGSPHL